MKVLAVVPARAGSKRLPGKNLRPLAGRPLVEWVLDAGLAARSIHRLVVSSDDPQVLELAASRGSELALPRPTHLATDTAPAIGYLQHALKTLEDSGEGPFDATVILQPTSPLTLPEDIDGVVELLETSGADSAVSVVRVDHAIHPIKLKTLEGDRLRPWLEEERGRMAEHQLPELWVRNCAVYATRRAVVDTGEILGADCRGYPMPRERSVDINEEIDLELARLLVARRR